MTFHEHTAKKIRLLPFCFVSETSVGSGEPCVLEGPVVERGHKGSFSTLYLSNQSSINFSSFATNRTTKSLIFRARRPFLKGDLHKIPLEEAAVLQISNNRRKNIIGTFNRRCAQTSEKGRGKLCFSTMGE